MPRIRQDALGGALGLALGMCLLFWLIPRWVEPDEDLRLPVSLVPQIVAVGFVLCGAAMLIRATLAPRGKPGQATGGFAPGEFRGLTLMILVLLVATLGFQALHFLVVAPAIIAVSMWMFGPIRPVGLVLTSAIGPILIWVLSTHVLGRVLP
ncbi:MAG: hypothetical protein OXH76_18995 [Boseongicola sp.]|nr:hypothetical protein [Boseongicola sp.]